MTGFCRNCDTVLTTASSSAASDRCTHCGGRRLIFHDELFDLSIAHIDCDSFYASVEKRDDPSLRGKPVIVGGGKRGVVSAACYIARIYGIHSAMPMFKALKACPDAVVIKPDMAKYSAIGKEIRRLMQKLTPAVEPISIDEAFLDLTGTMRLLGAPPAIVLSSLVRRIEGEIGITVSVGLSYNKFLAKIASDLDKPRGFSIIGRGESKDFLARQPVSIIWGVGKAMCRKLSKDGIQTVGQLQQLDEETLLSRYGSLGHRLYRLSHGDDSRTVHRSNDAKSVSSETTFNEDLANIDQLEARLWPLCEVVSRRMKAANMVGHTLTLKLKTKDFRLRTRSRQTGEPTNLAEDMYQAARPMLASECDGTAFRLIGIGLSDLSVAGDHTDQLLDSEARKRAEVEHTLDAVRDKLGPDIILKGRSLRSKMR
ncbi:MAG: DNA polymerase IV [Rhodospirillaceae bacterium]|nr:DNA polymerase IV [Rhodospirillaceae bacterium]MCY4311433.1 DNA polymerase IV [Rhodospirillaceae bacterium]